MNLEAQVETLKTAIRDVPDFPKPGIVFKDITTLLQDAVLFRRTVDLLVVLAGDRPVDRIVAIESRGFLLGGALAHRLGAGLVLVRKPGKLPWKTVSASYELEYGTDSVEMHEDALAAGIWAATQTGSLFLSLWCFFLVQALFVAIPVNMNRKTAPGSSQRDPEDRFQHAHRVAESALRRLSSLR